MMIDWWHRASWGVLCMAALWCNARAETRFEFSEPQMGVPFRIVMYAGDESTARTAARAAFDRISQLNSILSDYDSDSELSRLSRSSGSGRDVPIGQELWEVLSRGQVRVFSGDVGNQIHFDPAFAARLGYRAPLAQGLMTMLWMVGRLAEETGLSVPLAVTARFRRPVFWDDRMVLAGRRDASGRLIRLETRNTDGRITAELDTTVSR